MNPIRGIDDRSQALSIGPGQMTKSDIVGSPGPNHDVRFGLVGDGVDSTIKNLKAMKDDSAASGESLQAAMEKLNSELRQRRISLSFSVDRGTDSVVVKVVDSESGKLIRQIPPDEMLSLRQRFDDLAGMLVDQHI